MRTESRVVLSSVRRLPFRMTYISTISVVKVSISLQRNGVLQFIEILGFFESRSLRYKIIIRVTILFWSIESVGSLKDSSILQ